jgi:hypothetical protein
MNENKIPYLSDDVNKGPDGAFEDKNVKNTLRDGLEEIEVYETIQKIRNYYNGHHNIDGRPPSKKNFNEFLDSLDKNL